MTGQLYRVLITGSREWHDEGTLYGALQTQWTIAQGAGKSLMVIHGAARGADTLASEWAASVGLPGIFQMAYPAEWERYGQRAGFERNQKMVDDGADVCLAFVIKSPGKSKGTRDCMRRAKKAGIPIIEHTQGAIRG
ncbi:hypothetical protein SEA_PHRAPPUCCINO_141 [Mycobacterium phage Phrappuccino]|uniref:YspA cpYpsA-related SLOG domain-containing protein n=1 Tax=Mycobacterium phage Phrappuccino TaxID=2591223 RepID=A0A514DDY1_9CAUD|nr:hypothetical protein KHQ87_gp141 [Mycobacterium phage Phrappuccino]QDH91816.1 hypothetical protein SEA_PHRAPPUCCINO_141 [Mycobacterium phage Phrappuccino]QIQ63258.1 hypothetical protein SEA_SETTECANDELA_141 [Mycobacterium phage Settecandela]